MKYAWIDKQSGSWGLDEMCRVICVSESGYRAWKRGGKPERKRLTDAQMLVLIQAIHVEFKGAYGSPRMFRELRARGYPASKERVERLMQENDIKAKHKRRVKRDDGLQTQPADRSKPAGSELHPRSAEPSLDIRHHLPIDG